MKIKIGVFFGGNSVEHEVSIITALQAIENIDKTKYEVVPIYIAKNNKMYCGKDISDMDKYKDIPKLLKQSFQVTLSLVGDRTALLKTNAKFFEKSVYDYIDIAFPIVHGSNVEDGTLQGYLKMFNLPFVGCDILASSTGMDKHVCKCVLKDNAIPVLDCECVLLNDYLQDSKTILDNLAAKFGFPVIVKPINLGSSIGIQIAKDAEELKSAVDNAFTFANKILIERAIKNLKEVNCSVVGDYESATASECEEPVKNDEILSFNDKYICGNKKFGGSKSMNAGVLKLPAEISKEMKEKIQDLSIKTFRALDCSGVIRIDFMIDQDSNEVFVNEVNTIPGSLSFHLWQATGVDYPDHLNKLIELSLKRYREEKKFVHSFESNILSTASLHGLKK